MFLFRLNINSGLKKQKYIHVFVFASLFRINLNKENDEDFNSLIKNNLCDKKYEKKRIEVPSWYIYFCKPAISF